MERPPDEQTGTTAVADRGRARDARDADFAAYLAARQPSLLRTAYLLTGNRHDAEDLVQTAFAKLYLSWDKVRDHGSMDGYVRRILVNEHNSAVAARLEEARAHRGRLRAARARQAPPRRA